MTVSNLDDKPALIVIDLQKGILHYPTVHPIPDVIANSAALAAAFRARAYPVVLVNVTGGATGRVEQSRARGERQPDWSDIVPEMDHRPDDIIITKQTWGAFHNTPLHDELQKRGVTQVFVTGVATSAGVESTMRQAYERNYNVVGVSDAMTESTIESHENSVQRIFPRIGEVGTTKEVLDLFDW